MVNKKCKNILTPYESKFQVMMVIVMSYGYLTNSALFWKDNSPKCKFKQHFLLNHGVGLTLINCIVPRFNETS